MIQTRITKLLDIEHPVLLGGMASITAPELAAAVSNAGGLGGVGGSYLDAARMNEVAADMRSRTENPFAINFLLFVDNQESFAAALEDAPAMMAFAWSSDGQYLSPWFDRAHDAGCKVMFMADSVEGAIRGAEAGADIIVTQGTEGGGHAA